MTQRNSKEEPKVWDQCQIYWKPAIIIFVGT